MRILFLLAIFVLSLYNGNGQPAPFPTDIKVNAGRIESRILELSKYGKDSLGRGYRVAYTKGDVEARAWYINLAKKAGLEVSVDYAGNIVGKRKGRNPSLEPIAFGSHLDMVPDGGNYDGCVGSIGALEVIESLNEHSIITDHPLEVLIFSNEEGGTIGSSMLASPADKAALNTKSQSGLTIAEGLRAIGGNPDSVQMAVRKKGDLAAYLELHIEQGGILDQEKLNIGVVEGIVGILDWEITVEGFANHAGTTPMNNRKDALLAASRLVIAVNEVITSHEGRQVGTVGRISASPGAFNVIPGKVVMSLEIRDLSADKIQQLFREVQARADAIAKASGTTISFKPVFNPARPALSDPAIQAAIVRSAQSLGLNYRKMQSGAGHDAQEMALIASMGMIFVPSVGGISHSPKEFTSAADMANGTNMLLRTILALDKSLK